MCSSNSLWGENNWWWIIIVVILIWICCCQNNNGYSDMEQLRKQLRLLLLNLPRHIRE